MKFFTSDNDSHFIGFSGADPFFSMIRSIFSDEGEVMKSDMVTRDGETVLTVEMPGFNKENISIAYQDGMLTVSAQTETAESDGDYALRERKNSCSRTYEVGNIDESKVTAAYENGVLTITLPKAADIGGKKIKIL